MEAPWRSGELIESLAALGPAIPAQWHGKALTVLQTWAEDGPRVKALANLLPYLDDVRKTDVLISFAECAGRLNRKVVLGVLPEFVPVIAMAEGAAGVARVGRSILEVGLCFS